MANGSRMHAELPTFLEVRKGSFARVQPSFRFNGMTLAKHTWHYVHYASWAVVIVFCLTSAIDLQTHLAAWDARSILAVAFLFAWSLPTAMRCIINPAVCDVLHLLPRDRDKQFNGNVNR